MVRRQFPPFMNNDSGYLRWHGIDQGNLGQEGEDSEFHGELHGSEGEDKMKRPARSNWGGCVDK